MHLNVTVSPSVTVFCGALVVSLVPSSLSKNTDQIKILNLCLFHGSFVSTGYKS